MSLIWLILDKLVLIRISVSLYGYADCVMNVDARVVKMLCWLMFYVTKYRIMMF